MFFSYGLSATTATKSVCLLPYDLLMSGNNVLLAAITVGENELLVRNLGYNKAVDAWSLETINTAQLGEQHDYESSQPAGRLQTDKQNGKVSSYYLFLASCVSHAKERWQPVVTLRALIANSALSKRTQPPTALHSLLQSHKAPTKHEQPASTPAALSGCIKNQLNTVSVHNRTFVPRFSHLYSLIQPLKNMWMWYYRSGLSMTSGMRESDCWKEDLEPAPKSVSANGCNGPKLQRDTGNKTYQNLELSYAIRQHLMGKAPFSKAATLSLCPSKCGACWGALLHWGQNLRDSARQKYNTLHNCLPGTSGCSVNITSLSFIAPSGKFRPVQKQQKPKQNCD